MRRSLTQNLGDAIATLRTQRNVVTVYRKPESCMAVEGYQRIRSSLQKIFSQGEADKLRHRLAKAAAGTFGLKVATTGLSFTINILLARLLGTADYGAYTYAMAWVSLLGVPAVFGLDTLLVRNIAAYQAQSAWGMMRGIINWANKVVFFASVGLALLAAMVAWYLPRHLDSQMLPTLWVALIVLPLMAMTRLRQSAMQGLAHVVSGQLPEMLIRPVLLLGFVGVTYIFLGKGLHAPWAMAMNIAATAVAFCVGAYLLHETIPQTVKEASPVYQSRLWLKSALPLIFIASMNAIHTYADIIMLGAIKGAKVTGMYVVANQGATIILFVLVSVNAALAPNIANIYAVGDMKRLQELVTKGARTIFMFSLPIALSLIFFGYWFLLLFGQEFTQAKTALAILCTGQLVNAAMGSVGLLLIMTGYERDAALGVGLSAGLDIILNMMLIPRWNLQGAATATTTSIIIWNVLLAFLVYKRLGIHSTALGNISNWRNKS